MPIVRLVPHHHQGTLSDTHAEGEPHVQIFDCFVELIVGERLAFRHLLEGSGLEVRKRGAAIARQPTPAARGGVAR